MANYTPTVNEIRHAYLYDVKTVENVAYKAKGHAPMTEPEIQGEFDRFLSSVRGEG